MKACRVVRLGHSRITCSPLRVIFASHFCESFLRVLFASPFCESFLRVLFASPFCESFLRVLSASPFCESFLRDPSLSSASLLLSSARHLHACPLRSSSILSKPVVEIPLRVPCGGNNNFHFFETKNTKQNHIQTITHGYKTSGSLVTASLSFTPILGAGK